MKLETEKQIKSKKVRRKEIEFASTFMLSEPEWGVLWVSSKMFLNEEVRYYWGKV